MNRKHEVVIDKNKQWESPSILKRILHSLLAVFFGALLAQVMLFAFWHGSIVMYLDHLLFIPYLIGCAIFGAIYGDKFIFTLRRLISEWWNLWGL